MNMRKSKREVFTAEEIEIARTMWKDKSTYTQIGEKLGRTNNSVSGLMGRNRDIFPERFGDLMKKNKSAKSLRAKPRKTVKQRVSEAQARISANSLRRMFSEAFKPPVPLPKQKEQHLAYDASRLPGVTMMDLDEKRCCRWPLLDTVKGETQYFCGEAKSGKNYCEQHQARSVRMVA